MLRRLRSLCSTCEHCRPRRALALLYQPPAVTVKRDMERNGLLRAYICVFVGVRARGRASAGPSFGG